MTESVVAGPARPGDLLGGRYRLERLIGEGGMGSVWRAVDTALERTVAVKVFWGTTAENSDAARRDSEKRLLAAVSHPSLVTLFDAHIPESGLSYLVMEHVEGGTLASLMERGPVALRDAASLATDLGEALHVVHQAGIIHRDVKPANILLRPPLTPEHTFRAVLADFGIAWVADAARVTSPGTAIGTAAYISPEQVRGHPPTPASDIYSLGLVLLEALSGRRAYSAQTPVEAITVRLAASPRIPGDWGYGWRSLLTAMTALDPADRPDALEVARRGRALDTTQTQPALTLPVHIAETAPAPVVAAAVVAPTEPMPVAPLVGKRRRERRRRPKPLAALLLSAAAAAVVIAVGVWFGVASATPSPTLRPEFIDPAPAEPLIDPTPLPEEPVGDTGAVTDPAPVDPAPAGPATDDDSGSSNDNSGPGNNNGKGKGSDSSGNGNGKGGG
jgi:hypothetical protein